MRSLRIISTLTLALLVLVSSTSFMVSMHLCRGVIQNVALFSKAEGCEMERMLPPCHRHMQAPCCEDETVLHEATDFKASLEQIQLAAPAPIEIDQPLILVSEVIPSVDNARTYHFNYDPPPLPVDVTVDLGVFLI